MTASWPTSVKSFTTWVNGQVTQATMLTDIQDEVVALETYSRPKLTAARTYYVRTDGSDSNTGLADTAGGAFLTIQAAINAVAALDTNGQTVTIQVRDGTFTGANTLRHVVGTTGQTQLIIQGNSSTPTNVIISTTGAAFTCTGFTSVWTIKDMKITTASSGSCIRVEDATIRFSGVDFGASAGDHIAVLLNGLVYCVGNYTISGNATRHISAASNGIFNNGATPTVTVTADVTVTNFVLSVTLGYINAVSMTFSLGAFAVTGQRYNAASNSVINTNGGGANFFPGNSAGATATGAQYI